MENEKQPVGEEQELSEVEIAELANKEIRQRDAEIADLKRKLAKSKLYSTAEEEEEAPMTREECLKLISDPHTSNYDYAVGVVGLVEAEIDAGRSNPLGADGQEVYEFFKDVIEECGDDKSRFCSIYQARLGADAPSTAMAYKKRK